MAALFNAKGRVALDRCLGEAIRERIPGRVLALKYILAGSGVNMCSNLNDLLHKCSRRVTGKLAAETPVHALTALGSVCPPVPINAGSPDSGEVVRVNGYWARYYLQNAAEGVPLGAARRLMQVVPNGRGDRGRELAIFGGENGGPSCPSKPLT